MSYGSDSITEFIDALASGEPTPGGGGASAIVGAVGAALGSMVCNLTLGNKKYDDFRDDITKIIEECIEIQKRLTKLADEDAEAFKPLAAAYRIPKNDPDREQITERALKLACVVPLEIMKVSGRAVELHAQLYRKGSAAALSDVGAGVICCKAALEAASLNIFINIKSMRDRRAALELEAEADELLGRYRSAADEVYAEVLSRLR